jgi:hypothetical protein
LTLDAAEETRLARPPDAPASLDVAAFGLEPNPSMGVAELALGAVRGWLGGVLGRALLDARTEDVRLENDRLARERARSLI